MLLATDDPRDLEISHKGELAQKAKQDVEGPDPNVRHEQFSVRNEGRWQAHAREEVDRPQHRHVLTVTM